GHGSVTVEVLHHHLVARRAMSTPLKNMYDWANRSLPVTARLRSKFFITIWWPAGPCDSVEENVGKTTAISASCRARLGY
ncbi:MAG: hypothetical protein ABSH09_35950, partial [Bryobacteraceae bacterium]